MTEPLDELFALAPEEFTARRDTLVKELKAAKEGDLAAKVKALRRPTVAAWALNQVARRHADAVDELIAAGEALAAAQRRLMGGDKSSGIREATQARRQAVATLRDHAAAILRDAGVAPDTHLDEVNATLEAASADPDAADALRAGMLQRPLPAPSGLGFGFLPAPADEDEEPGPDWTPADAPDEEPEDEDAAAARAEAEKAAAVEDAERRLAEARTRRDEVSEREDSAHAAAAEAKQRAETLRRDLKAADAEAERTAKEAEAASDDVQAAEEEVAAAGAALRKLRRA